MKKTVLITGGVRGIGLAIAKAFQEKEYQVFVTYSKDEESAKKAQTLGFTVYKADVADEKQVADLFTKLPVLDVLVNNAGVCLFKQLQDTTKEEWDTLFAVNVGGAFLCSRAAVNAMIDKQKGAIINVSSVWGEVGASCESAYSASKAALLGFTKALAKELGYSGIRVNAVSPGVIDTQMNARLSQDEKASLQEEIPAGRMGTCGEVADAVLFLAENEYVNGVDLPVNGGFSIV